MAGTTLVPTAAVDVDRFSNLVARGPRPITQCEPSTDRDYLKETPEGVECTVVQSTKTTSRKSSAPRKILYHYLLENPEFCPVTVL